MDLLPIYLWRPTFKKKTLKTIFAFLYAVIAMNWNLIVLAIVHDKVPNRHLALPDIGFDLLPRADWALNFSELVMVGEVILVFVVIGFQNCRGLLLRRLFVVVGSTYILRGFFMYATVFPPADNWHGCAPQLNRSQATSRGKFWFAPIAL